MMELLTLDDYMPLLGKTVLVFAVEVFVYS